MLRYLLLLVIALLTPPAAAATEEYVFILRARSNPYWDVIAQGIKDAAAMQGVKANIYQTQTDVSAEEQLNICQAMLLAQPKVLIISAMTPSVGIECMKAATAKGVIVADIDASMTPQDAAKKGIPLAFTVGSDNYLVGQNAARYVQQALQKSDPRILVIEGPPASRQGTSRVVGFKDEITKLLPHARVVASISGEWDRLKAMNITTDTLQRWPDLNVIYTANDQMALGAVEAVRITRKHDQVMVIGVDGTKDARNAVVTGKMLATIAQLPYLIGKRALEKALDVAAGRKTEPVEITPTPVLDKKTLTENRADFMQYVR